MSLVWIPVPILDVHFSHWFVVKTVCLNKTENEWKWGRSWFILSTHFYVKSIMIISSGWRASWHWTTYWDRQSFNFWLKTRLWGDLEMWTVWPYWAKFRHLYKLSKIYGTYLRVYLVLDKIMICFDISIIHFMLIWSINRSQIMKNNVTIWSHWMWLNLLNGLRRLTRLTDDCAWKAFLWPN